MNETPSAETPSWTAPYRFRVALRLLRTRKINLISVFGIMLGVGSIIVVMSVMDGFQMDLRDMLRGTLSDVIIPIHPEGDYRAVKRELEGLEDVHAVSLQLQTFGAIPVRNRAADGTLQSHLPVRVVGIIPEHERDVSDIVAQMEPLEGHPDPFALDEEIFDVMIGETTPPVAISRRMARDLRVGLGSTFVLLTLEEDEEDSWRPNSREVVVTRLFSSRNSEYDNQHIYTDLGAGRSNRPDGFGRVLFPGAGGTVAELRVRLAPGVEAADAVVARLGRAAAKHDPSVRAGGIQTWQERRRPLLRAVNNEKFLLAFVLFFIVLVGCFTIFATLTMTVVEKTRDIGVLRALGATASGIMGIFLLNGALVGIVGAGLGYGVGLYVAHNVDPIRLFLRDTFGWDIFPANIYLFDTLPSHVDHAAAAMFAIAAAVAAVAAALYPSFRAARLRPVDALRYE